MNAKEFYENQLHDKTTVVGRLEKDEIIELMQAYHEVNMKKEIKRAYSKGYAKGFNEGQIVEANYNKSKM
jgi:uncharacterized protein YqgV (UPF0045/DUF77 family)